MAVQHATGPSLTCSPTTQKGPILTSSAISAAGCTTAVGCISGMAETSMKQIQVIKSLNPAGPLLSHLAGSGRISLHLRQPGNQQNVDELKAQNDQHQRHHHFAEREGAVQHIRSPQLPVPGSKTETAHPPPGKNRASSIREGAKHPRPSTMTNRERRNAMGKERRLPR